MSNNQIREFLKMHGLGNDFVVFDARRLPLNLSPQEVSQIANRRDERKKGESTLGLATRIEAAAEMKHIEQPETRRKESR